MQGWFPCGWKSSHRRPSRSMLAGVVNWGNQKSPDQSMIQPTVQRHEGHMRSRSSIVGLLLGAMLIAIGCSSGDAGPLAAGGTSGIAGQGGHLTNTGGTGSGGSPGSGGLGGDGSRTGGAPGVGGTSSSGGMTGAGGATIDGGSLGGSGAGVSSSGGARVERPTSSHRCARRVSPRPSRWRRPAAATSPRCRKP